MKTLVTLSLLALLCFLYHSSAGPIDPPVLSGGFCCNHNKQVKIPKDKVKELKMSASHCNLKSLIVFTQKNHSVCMDANWSWAQTLLEDFYNRRNANPDIL